MGDKIKVDIDGIRVSITKEIDDFIYKKLKKVTRYLKNTIASHVILKLEKGRYETEINLSTKGLVINAKEISNDLYSSIEGAVKKVVTQSKKHKEKIRSHKAEGRKKVKQAIKEKLISEGIKGEPEILRITKELPKPMTVDEAAEQLRACGDNFFVFLNVETDQINVIYKKENGSFVLVEPS